MYRSVAQPGSASGLGPEGREFESLRPDQQAFPNILIENHYKYDIRLHVNL